MTKTLTDLHHIRSVARDLWLDLGGCEACRGLGVREVVRHPRKLVHDIVGAPMGYAAGSAEASWQPCGCTSTAGLDPTLTVEEVRRALPTTFALPPDVHVTEYSIDYEGNARSQRRTTARLELLSFTEGSLDRWLRELESRIPPTTSDD